MIEELLPLTVVAVEAFHDAPDETIYPGEEGQVAKVSPLRRLEFVTARRCAREALGRLGFPPAPIGTGPHREPLWPNGVVGAITHCVGYRAAAVTTTLASIGIDAEPNKPLPRDVANQITTATEASMLTELTDAYPIAQWGRLLFSAKESIYKAWYPLTGRWLGFEEAAVSIDPEARTFSVRPMTDGARESGVPLTHFNGRFMVTSSLILTAVTVG